MSPNIPDDADRVPEVCGFCGEPYAGEIDNNDPECVGMPGPPELLYDCGTQIHWASWWFQNGKEVAKTFEQRLEYRSPACEKIAKLKKVLNEQLEARPN